MNLKPIEQVKFDAIKNTVVALKSANLPHENVIAAVSVQVADFESTTRYVVKIHEAAQEDGQIITLIDTKRDFVRARLSGQSGQALRCKIFGVPVEIKAQKINEYEFTNAQIADALEELVKVVRRLDTEVSTAGNLDFSSADGKSKQAAPEAEAEVPGDEEAPSDIEPEDSEKDEQEEQEEVEQQ